MTIWIVTFGRCRNVYYTWYHADQIARALRLNGTPYTLEVSRGVDNWKNISIEHADISWNGSRMLFRQCQAVDVTPIRKPGWCGVDKTRCGADAMYFVTRTSLFSGNTYTDAMCEHHASQWGLLPEVKHAQS